ncbi:MAG: phage shock protein A [Crocinitomicaceae bacterium]|jgi:phage shock protein A
MSDRISQLIDKVREKAILYREQYVTERSKNDELLTENERLNESLSKQNANIEELKSEVESLKQVQKTTKVQGVVSSNETGVSDEQIDDLVKEIEYCIGQLKK